MAVGLLLSRAVVNVIMASLLSFFILTVFRTSLRAVRKASIVTATIKFIRTKLMTCAKQREQWLVSGEEDRRLAVRGMWLVVSVSKVIKRRSVHQKSNLAPLTQVACSACVGNTGKGPTHASSRTR
jgi:hypothetical protein